MSVRDMMHDVTGRVFLCFHVFPARSSRSYSKWVKLESVKSPFFSSADP